MDVQNASFILALVFLVFLIFLPRKPHVGHASQRIVSSFDHFVSTAGQCEPHKDALSAVYVAHIMSEKFESLPTRRITHRDSTSAGNGAPGGKCAVSDTSATPRRTQVPTAVAAMVSGLLGELPVRIDDEFVCDAGVEVFVPIWRAQADHLNHRHIVGGPSGPRYRGSRIHGTQTAGAVATAIAGSTAEAAAKVIAAKTITSANATVPVAAGKCAGRKPGTSETNDNCKTTVALRNIDDLCKMLRAFTSIQGPFGDRLPAREPSVDLQNL
jgi:hypothetical protein